MRSGSPTSRTWCCPTCARDDLYGLWRASATTGWRPPNIGLDHGHHRLPRAGLLQPGQRPLDPGRPAIGRALRRPERQHEIGDLKIKISGCINACGHHHVGHIGILGVDKKGEEFYQITLGGSPTSRRPSATSSGPAFSYDRGRRCRRNHRRHLPRSPRKRPNPSLPPTPAWASKPFKEKLYATH